MRARRRFLALLGLSLALAGAASAQAPEPAPQRPVRIVVPFAAGGTADVLARITAQALSARWSQQVVVDNRLGAGGHIGAEMVARSPGDGATLAARLHRHPRREQRLPQPRPTTRPRNSRRWRCWRSSPMSSSSTLPSRRRTCAS